MKFSGAVEFLSETMSALVMGSSELIVLIRSLVKRVVMGDKDDELEKLSWSARSTELAPVWDWIVPLR
jgi:hypothetical protein